MAKTINSRIPEGPVAEKWTNYKAHQRLVNPKNKLKLDIIVVGTGLLQVIFRKSIKVTFCQDLLPQDRIFKCKID